MDYRTKYIKYKMKYLFFKNQKAGNYESTLRGKPIQKITLNPKSDNLRNLMYYILRHEYLNKLSARKIVATPNSGNEPLQYRELWNSLDAPSKEWFTEFWFPTQYGVILGVYINEYALSEDGPFMGNLILFYSIEYITLLEEATGINSQDLLKIMSNVQAVGSYEHDLILIAFGDLFGNIPDVVPTLATDEGKRVFETYKKLAEIRS
jgi:hypothetical protein